MSLKKYSDVHLSRKRQALIINFPLFCTSCHFRNGLKIYNRGESLHRAHIMRVQPQVYCRPLVKYKRFFLYLCIVYFEKLCWWATYFWFYDRMLRACGNLARGFRHWACLAYMIISGSGKFSSLLGRSLRSPSAFIVHSHSNASLILRFFFLFLPCTPSSHPYNQQWFDYSAWWRSFFVISLHKCLRSIKEMQREQTDRRDILMPKWP